MRYDLTHAILSIAPGASWSITGDDYKSLVWDSGSVEKPSEKALRDEVTRLQAAWDAKEYQRLRAAAYPPVTDYLDAVVKGDTTAIQQYVDACLGVKAKYPKPRG